MNDFKAYKESTIRYWERRRILYNLALLLPAFFGYGLNAGISAGVGDLPRFGFGVVLLLFLLSAVGANICFSLGYALEFIFGTDVPESRWPRFWRPLFVLLGTMFAMLLSVFGGRSIAALEYSFR